mmetsp:Transcript_177583/g.569506  ORF Transcript_177583/g.569506 Transcript_177583/m.569506 type:complete len:556 (-) Transcript_177583:145-1812(-)|eukprot:CAMPEP_0203890914 /NCGR_PEP_ID=MMETSP0359-20131031/34281_1 /ASSEMBLY_ACC=CAM_ASM_000338 /TAXON_ID=268821 /ORGANISM="Scrippsiella Hangoei, Strain SHTV-5" /LENGTH=555 /DNA_ID=CAMNT_0050812623 /DNA_START=19 /DNA_END=1686 /DNA_ORIENTATION=+
MLPRDREEKAFPKPAPRPQRHADDGNGAPRPGRPSSLRGSEQRRPNSGDSPNPKPASEEPRGAGYAQRPSQTQAPSVAQRSRPPIGRGVASHGPQQGLGGLRSEGGPSSSAGDELQSEAPSSSAHRPVVGKRPGKGKSKMTQVKVFVRWRPLVGDELKRGDAAVGYTCAEKGGSESVSVTSDRTRVKTWTGNGFTGVFQHREGNVEVFERVVAPMLSMTLEGKSACCFCYGHTGSGKTHTVLGYGADLGLYRLGSARIFEAFAAVKEQPLGGLQLSVRFAELHCGRAFDLMDSRAECQVREDADGQVHFRKDPTLHADGRVRVRPMSSICCKSAEDVAAAVAVGSSLRVVGSSSLHDQSSRSHAILEMEVVTQELLAAREAVIHEESLLVPLGKALEEINFNAAQGQDVDTDLREEHLARVTAQAEVLEAAREHVADLLRCGPPGLGGTLVLVDLAGSEHGADADLSGRKQTPAEIREAKEINQSLLFLKEVVRALASGSGHVPYRSCRLTRVMRHWLRDGCCCSMVANVSTSDLHAVKSVSTLQYAVLVASAGA